MTKDNKHIDSIINELPPPPREPRIIRPAKKLLWKNYLKLGVFFLINLAALLAFYAFIIVIVNEPDNQFNNAFIGIMTLIFSLTWIVIGGFYCIALPFYINSMEFIVHGNEIVVKKGLINKTEKHVPYRAVTNIDTLVGPFDRLFNIGNIMIQTAGGTGSSGGYEQSEEKLEGLVVYREVRDYIIDQLHNFRIKRQRKQVITDTDDISIIKKNIIYELQSIKKVLLEKE